MKHSLTIRMTAANWDAVLADGTRFDFRDMDTASRKRWYGSFMSSVRKFYRNRMVAAPLPSPKRPRRRSRRRPNANS